MNAIEQSLRFPPSISHRERELWERAAAELGHTSSESSQAVMERHPIEEGEGRLLYRKRVETIRRSEAAIQDGRKEEPAQNARTYGFTAQNFRLTPGEREGDYAIRISDALKRHQPQDSEELDQIVIIVNSTWLLLRLQCAASDLMCVNYEAGTTPSDALLLKNGLDFNALSRYEGNLNRTLDKARQRLKELKKDRGTGGPPMDESVRGVGVSPATEEPAKPQGSHANNQQLTRQRLITKQTQDSERGAGVPPAKEEGAKPQSPLAEEPKTKITKRTQPARRPWIHPCPIWVPSDQPEA